MKLAIVSLSRSGSTLMYYDLLSALPSTCLSFFEPTFDFTNQIRGAHHALVKLIIDRLDSATRSVLSDSAIRKILLTRDPRDRLISSLLFSLHGNQEEKLVQQLGILKQKVNNPTSISFLALAREILGLDSMDPIFDYIHASLSNMEDAINASNNSMQVRYEDYIVAPVQSLFSKLSLDYDHTAKGNIPGRHKYGLRRGSSGDWQDWFTTEDVGLLKPIFQKFIETHGYDSDWALSPNPTISRVHTIDFIIKAHRKNKEMLSHNILWTDSDSKV